MSSPDTLDTREGFQIVADLVKEFTALADMHAGTATIAIGPGITVRAMALPQAQLDLQQAIQRAFYEGAAHQARLNPWPSKIMIEHSDDRKETPL